MVIGSPILKGLLYSIVACEHFKAVARCRAHCVFLPGAGMEPGNAHQRRWSAVFGLMLFAGPESGLSVRGSASVLWLATRGVCATSSGLLPRTTTRKASR